MNYGAEPADQVVRYSLEGMEYSLKITGNVAKHVAVFIAAALKDQKKTRGKTRLTRMLKEQRPMKFFTVPGDRLKEFAKEAKARGILYVVIKDKVNPDQTEVMVFADDAAKMNRVLDRMNLDFVKAESGSMVTEAVEKETAPEKAENQMEKETGENVRTETVVLPEGKIEFELDDAEEMFQIGDEAFPEGNFTQAQEGEEKNPSEPFSRNRNTSSDREISWKEKNEKPSVRKELGDIRKEQEEKRKRPGETRLDLVNKNVAIFKSIIPEIAKRNFAGIMLVVANPVDILTQVAIKLSGLPENRVIGSGTVLDSARLRYKLGEHLSVDSRSVHAFIVGEHGDSEVVAWSSANVSGVPLSEMCEMRGHYKHKENTAEIATAVKNSAYEIINKKHATYYGIAMSVKRICEVIMRDEKSILPVSHMIHGVYDIDGVSLSMPAIVGADGIESDIPINLSGEEALKLKESADSLKKIIETIEL